MEDIIRVKELRERLKDLPDNAPVMIAVTKDPTNAEFGWGEDWDIQAAVEVVPLEREEVAVHNGMLYLQVELTDTDEELREINESHDR